MRAGVYHRLVGPAQAPLVQVRENSAPQREWVDWFRTLPGVPSFSGAEAGLIPTLSRSRCSAPNAAYKVSVRPRPDPAAAAATRRSASGRRPCGPANPRP